MDFGLIGIAVLFFLALAIIMSVIKTVPQGQEFTVERFGRFTRTLTPGLHFIVPFVDGIGYKMNMRERVLDGQRLCGAGALDHRQDLQHVLDIIVLLWALWNLSRLQDAVTRTRHRRAFNDAVAANGECCLPDPLLPPTIEPQNAI